MKRTVFLLLAGLLLPGASPCAGFAQVASRPAAPSENRAEELRAQLLDRSPGQVFVAAHRGDWRGFPENSLEAIDSAIRMGVDIVETDVSRTKDGQFVLMHDTTLDRTTTGKGTVGSHTLDEIRALRLRNGCAIVTPYGVPTLEEALLLVKGRVLLNLDKSEKWLPEIFELLEKTGTTRQIVIKSYDQPVERALAADRELLAKAIFMPIVTFKKPGSAALAEAYARQVRPPAMEIVYAEWNPEIEKAYAICAAAGIRVWANTLWSGMAGPYSDDAALKDPDGNYGPLLKRGASIIQSDRPEFLIRYLRARGRHP